MDHEAIYKAYPDVVSIGDDLGAFKADGTQVTLVQSNIDAARATLDADYTRKRAAEYPSIVDQLDYIYHNGIDKWKADIVDPVKAKYPKP